jgi:galactokinase
MVDFETLKHEYFKLPPNNDQFSWVLVDSKGTRSLAEGEYQKRVNQCHEALMILKQKGKASSYRTITKDNLKCLREWPHLLKRIRHMVEENVRAQKAKKFLLEGAFENLGDLLNQSHESLKNLYEVSTLELDVLQEEALKRGSYGSRMLGGGFGGCTLNLVPREKAKLFGEEMIEYFYQRFGVQTESIVLEIVGGTRFYKDDFLAGEVRLSIR